MAKVQTYLTAEDDVGQKRLAEITDAEAQEKLCVGPPGCGRSIGAPGNEERRCVGSRCMAWRWGLSLMERTVVLDLDPNTRMVRRVGDGPNIPMENREHIDAYQPEGEGWALVSILSPHNSLHAHYQREHAKRGLHYQREHAKRGYCGFMEQRCSCRPSN